MDFFDALVRYETDLWNHLDARLKPDGVSLADLMSLRIVASRDGSARVSDLRTGLRVTVGAASKLVDRLERRGFVARSADPDDGRSSFVGLTAAGSQALRRAEAVAALALDAHLSRVRDDIDALTATLDELDSDLVVAGERASA